MGLRYGVAALARPTFDVPFAEEMKERAFAALAAAGIEAVGPRELLFDRAAAERAIGEIRAAAPIDLLLVLQVPLVSMNAFAKERAHGTDELLLTSGVSPGDLVVSQGEPGRSLFVVASGTVKVTRW